MTALCPGGGTSGVKPGAFATVGFTTSLIDLLLTKYRASWLIPFVNVLSTPVLQLSTFCATDPPAIPSFTLTDITALLAPFVHPADAVVAGNKVADLLQHLAWYEFCQCTGGSPTPVPDPPVTQPTGAPSYVPATQSLCIPMEPARTKVKNLWTGATNASAPAGWEGMSYDDSAWATGVLADTSTAFQSINSTLYGLSPECLSTGTCPAQAVAPSTLPTSNAEEFLIRWRFELPDGFDYTTVCARLSSWFVPGGFGGWSTGSVRVNDTAGGNVFNSFSWQLAVAALHAGTNLMALYVNSGNTGNANTWNGRAAVGVTLSHQGALTTGDSLGCCPPDPRVELMLNQILQGVTLIQRQAVPFAYVPGTLHAGLTGANEFAVDDILGVKVSITSTLPSYVSSKAAHPTRLVGTGWFQWGTADGFGPRVPIEQVDTVSLPAAAGAYTRLAYSLPAGLTIAVLELVREP